MRIKLKNEKILKKLMAVSGCETQSDYADYLSTKYRADIARQQIKQFQFGQGYTLTSLLLREAFEQEPT